jgi:hypothetical protein
MHASRMAPGTGQTMSRRCCVGLDVVRPLLCLLLPFLLGAARAALLLPTNFHALLSLGRLSSTQPLLKSVSEKTPGQEAVEPLEAAGLNFDRETRRPMHEAHTSRGFVHMLPARSGGAHEGLFKIRLNDLQGLHAGLKGALFFLTDAELAHRCIDRLGRRHVTAHGMALPKPVKGEFKDH